MNEDEKKRQKEILMLQQTIAEVGYLAGCARHYGGDSRQDIDDYVSWAHEFEEMHCETDWDKHDYIILLDRFVTEKIESHPYKHTPL